MTAMKTCLTYINKMWGSCCNIYYCRFALSLVFKHFMCISMLLKKTVKYTKDAHIFHTYIQNMHYFNAVVKYY